MTIFHGSVTDMPFENKQYDGIFCYALIHLLNKSERAKFIQDCYNQLKQNGYMIFITISKEALMYGKGKQLGKDYFEILEGMKMFFYDTDSIKQEFEAYGLVEVSGIVEPHKNAENKPPFKFTMIKCQKGGRVNLPFYFALISSLSFLRFKNVRYLLNPTTTSWLCFSNNSCASSSFWLRRRWMRRECSSMDFSMLPS